MLTEQEVYDRHKELEDVITDARKQQKELLEQYVKELPYKVGDLVEVRNHKGIHRVYIGSMKPYVNGIIGGPVRVMVTFNKAKKDGTMSSVSAAINAYEKDYGIKVIKPA